MAVDFFRKPEVLIRDLKRKGFPVENVASEDGEPGRAMQIRVGQGLTVNWDRDSRSVWAEGPWPDVERLETFLRKRYQGGWLRQLRAHPGTAIAVVFLSLLVGLGFSMGMRASRKKASPASVPPTAAPAAPSPTAADASGAPAASDAAPAAAAGASAAAAPIAPSETQAAEQGK